MTEPTDIPGSQPTLLSRLTQTRLPLWISLALLVLWLITLGWHSVTLSRAEARLETERTAMTAQFDADRSALLGDVRSRVVAENHEARRQFGMALAWAVRGEMIRSNLDQVDQFFGEIVKLPNTERVLLVGSDGTVQVSTDRLHLGAQAATLVAPEALLLPEITVRSEADGTRLLVIPVMGLNTRLGTVIVTHRQADALSGL
ncbi:MAG: hypothetical protein Q7J36_00120 [Thiobacillus sp.]|nr:hypothetical protein [Thiobacillus sp.]